jgi:hypothetical protein
VFELRLSRALGMTRDDLLATITQAEFNLWLANESFDPLFDPWLGNALNCRTIAAAFNRRPPPLSAFLPTTLRRRQTASQLKASLIAISKRQHHGTD